LNIQKDVAESKAAKTPVYSYIKAFLNACTIRRFLLAVLAFSASSTIKHIFHGLGQSTNTIELNFELGKSLPLFFKRGVRNTRLYYKYCSVICLFTAWLLPATVRV
jgi:hypothetical protein